MTKTPEQEIAELKNSLAQANITKTLRDEFAMAALTGLLANRKLMEQFLADPEHEDWFADLAYQNADAMLRERKL
jgi:hypothetical protein